MEIDYYIKQFDSYGEILKKWKLYLEELQKQALSDKKSAIKIAELSDRKDLIACKDLKGEELLKELKLIHKLIDRERNEYKKLANDILKPSDVSLFSFKGSAVANKKKELKKRFNTLFQYNEEQQVRTDLLKKNLTLLKYKNVENEKIKLIKEKEDVKTEKTDNIATQKNEEIITKTEIIESTNKKPSEESEDFNYEDEIKKILGI